MLDYHLEDAGRGKWGKVLYLANPVSRAREVGEGSLLSKLSQQGEGSGGRFFT